MTEKTSKSLKPVGSRPNVICGLRKTHKASAKNCPPFRPNFWSLNAPTYKLVKHLMPTLKHFITNEFIAKHYFHLSEDTVDQQPNFFMGSLDVDSLFTHIPL